MKLSNNLIASAVLLATSSVALAANDTTNISINVTELPYVTLTGSLIANPAIGLTVAQVNNVTTTLGTLGTTSNVGGNCDVTITSDNGFELIGANSGNPLHGGATYSIDYSGTNYADGAVTGSAQVLCTSVSDANFDMVSPAVPAGVVTADTYSDIVRVIVATP